MYHGKIPQETLHPVYVISGIRYIPFALSPVLVVLLSKGLLCTFYNYKGVPFNNDIAYA